MLRCDGRRLLRCRESLKSCFQLVQAFHMRKQFMTRRKAFRMGKFFPCPGIFRVFIDFQHTPAHFHELLRVDRISMRQLLKVLHE